MVYGFACKELESFHSALIESTETEQTEKLFLDL